MSCSLLFYLACLASLCALTTAQSCGTTATWESCCQSPSSDGKTFAFEGRQFRVYCNKAVVANSAYKASIEECRKSCSTDPKCLDVHWKPPSSGTNVICETKSLENESKGLALVLVDSADQSQCTKDLQQCQKDLGNCKPGDPACPGNLQKCQNDLRNCKPGDPNCPGNLQKCQSDLRNCKPGDPACLGNLEKCNGAKKKCEGDLAQCKKKVQGDKTRFQCVEGKVETIGGARYRHHCNQVTTPANPRPFSSQSTAANIGDCARSCTGSGCKWLYYVVHTRTCAQSQQGWKDQTKNAFTTPGASGSGCTVLIRV